MTRAKVLRSCSQRDAKREWITFQAGKEYELDATLEKAVANGSTEVELVDAKVVLIPAKPIKKAVYKRTSLKKK